MGQVIRIAGSLLVYLIGGTVVGAVACLLLDVFVSDFDTSILPHVVWGVDGIFCGVVHFGFAGALVSPASDGKWENRPDARKIGRQVFWLTVVWLALLGMICDMILWSRSSRGAYLVPEGQSQTIVFLLSMIAGMWVGSLTLAEKK